jgi:UDP-glucose 4-epimerase
MSRLARVNPAIFEESLQTGSFARKVLVTGGAGFIGSHLVDRLLKQGCKVIVLDNLSTGKLENLKGRLGDPGFKFVKGDVRDRRDVEEAVKDVDAVFHLAAITSVPYSVRRPNVTRQVNVEGARNLLEACLRGRVERFIYVSSCAVYGEPEYLPIDEKHPARPISPYAESKLEAERLCREFQETYGLKTTVLRPFNVYGLGMRNDQYGGVIARFIERLRIGKPPIIYGDGEQTRDFIHVEDAVRAMILALESEKAVGRTFNVATGSPTSVNRLAQLIIDLFEAKGIKPKHRKARVGDVKHSYANIQEAKAILGFEPKISLKEGLSTLLHADREEKLDG